MGVMKWYQLRKERLFMQDEINRLKLEEKNLVEEIDCLENDDEYIMKMARERFHMVKPGEKVFRVIDSPKYNQVISGNVIIDVANPRNLTGHKAPNPSYPHLVHNQKK